MPYSILGEGGGSFSKRLYKKETESIVQNCILFLRERSNSSHLLNIPINASKAILLI